MSATFPWTIFEQDEQQRSTKTEACLQALSSQGISACESQPVLSLMSNYCLVEVKGPDAERFMQGQFTCDVAAITKDRAGLGCCCNNKGRMLGLFRIVRMDADHFLLRLPKTVADTLVAHLGKYKAFFKCSCEVNKQWACMAYLGAVDQLSNSYSAIPTSEGEICSHEGALIIKSSAGSQHFEIWLAASQAETRARALIKACDVVNESVWNLLEIKTGTGEVYDSTVGEFIPQMFNLQAMDGVSFKKGCYTGQEIVARMQYLGKLKKRLYLLQANGPGFAVNDKVYGNDHSVGDNRLISDKKSKLGTIIRTEQLTEQQHMALAVLDQDPEERTLWIGEAQETEAHRIPLPYQVPEQKNQRPKKD